MEYFDFRARTAKDEAILGLGFSFIFMLPMLPVVLAAEYISPGIIRRITTNSFLELALPVIPLLSLYCFMGKLREKTTHEYSAVLDERDIKICEDEKEVFSGKVTDIAVEEKSLLFRLDIYTEGDKISIRARAKGADRLLGESTAEDIQNLRSLSERLRMVTANGEREKTIKENPEMKTGSGT